MKIEAEISGGVLAIPQSDQSNLSAEDWAARFRDNDDGKTIEGTPVYPAEMPEDGIDPETGLERRTGKSSVRMVMEQKMAQQAMDQDPALEEKQAAFMKWYMENKEIGKGEDRRPLKRPDLQQSGPRGAEYNTRPGLTPEELKALEESDIDPLA